MNLRVASAKVWVASEHEREGITGFDTDRLNTDTHLGWLRWHCLIEGKKFELSVITPRGEGYYMCVRDKFVGA